MRSITPFLTSWHFLGIKSTQITECYIMRRWSSIVLPERSETSQIEAPPPKIKWPVQLILRSEKMNMHTGNQKERHRSTIRFSFNLSSQSYKKIYRIHSIIYVPYLRKTKRIWKISSGSTVKRTRAKEKIKIFVFSFFLSPPPPPIL